MMRRAPRAIRVVVVAALMGVLTTVATSWLLALVIPTPRATRLVGVWDGESSWQVNLGRAFGATRREWFEHFHVPRDASEEERRRWLAETPYVLEPGEKPSRLSKERTGRSPGEPYLKAEPYLKTEHTRGWPLQSMWYAHRDMFPESESMEGGYLVRVSRGRRYNITALPVRVLPLGFATNSLLYGIVWTGILFGVPALRAATRRQRGRCPACGYDLSATESPTCPECGSPRV